MIRRHLDIQPNNLRMTHLLMRVESASCAKAMMWIVLCCNFEPHCSGDVEGRSRGQRCEYISGTVQRERTAVTNLNVDLYLTHVHDMRWRLSFRCLCFLLASVLLLLYVPVKGPTTREGGD